MKRSLLARFKLARELLHEFESEETVSEQFDYASAIDRILASGLAKGGMRTAGRDRWREATKKYAAQYDSRDEAKSA